jgi:glycosyltransferase involved in cell wall biosynthesis
MVISKKLIKNPVISVIIPCYNQGEYLRDALKSVEHQYFSEWECIIVNDGSSDCTEKIAKEYVNKDRRFSYIYQENAGLSKARNIGIHKAIGEFILPLDADDCISPQYIKLAIKAFDKDPLIKVVYCKAEKFGVEQGLWELLPFSLSNLKLKNMIFCSAIFRKDDWKRVNGYDENLKQGWEDWEFWIAILKNGGKVKQLNSIGFYYRTKPKSMIKNMDIEIQDNVFSYINIKHLDFFEKKFDSFKSSSEQIMDVKIKNKTENKNWVLSLISRLLNK